MHKKIEIEFADRPLSIETGRMAKQAGGSALVQYGETVVLATACMAPEPREKVFFTPLTVDYIEKTFAAGKIPGGFFKREGRPGEKEVLTSRFIDRPIRPLFPKGWAYETQVITTVLSADKDNDPDIVAIIGASAALTISEIPFAGPIAGARMGRLGEHFVLNPTQEILEDTTLNVIVVGSKDAVVMVEGGAEELPEADMIKAIMLAHEHMQPVIDLQNELREAVGKTKVAFTAPPAPDGLEDRVRTVATERFAETLRIPEKLERYGKKREVKKAVKAELAEEFPEGSDYIGGVLEDIEAEIVRGRIIKDGIRIDGRKVDQVRPIATEVGVLPRTHGSSLFTRGETQALATTTLGTRSDEQKIDSLMGESYKRFMLHYNFPPFCVGEVKFLRSPGRREIGHGALAERALRPVLPSEDQEFPYTIRVVSEVLESNGSSSMASVCSGCLAMMDAGVPIKGMVAGVAMGLIKEGDDIAVLTDILGDEDHLGDMDFKVTGTREGITALQMDIKIAGVNEEVLTKALGQARDARLHIIDEMAKSLDEPRTEVSRYAPTFATMKIRIEQIRDVIGPGGKHIRDVTTQSGCSVDVDDEGQITIAGPNQEATDFAVKLIKGYLKEVNIGEVYEGVVRRITDFGAFVEIMPGLDGLVHISHMADHRVRSVEDVTSEGEKLLVKVIDVDRTGKVRLSHKEALAEADTPQDAPDA